MVPMRAGDRRPALAAGLLVLVVAAATVPFDGALLLVGAATAAGGLLVACAARPERAVVALVALLPWQTVVFALLYARGAPAGLVRAGGLWKEAVVAGIVLGVVARLRRGDLHVDGIDALTAVLLAVALVYFAAPGIGSIGGRVAPAEERFVALRGAVFHLLLFLAIRRLPGRRVIVDRVVGWVLRSAVVLAVGVVVESQVPDVWRELTIRTLRVHVFRTDVLGSPTTPFAMLHIGGEAQRFGSFLYSPFALAYYLLLALGLLLGTRRWGAWTAPALVLVGAGILLSGSRAAAVAAGVLVVLDLIGRARFESVAKSVVLAGAVLVVGVVLASSVGIADRFGSAGATSTTGHQARSTAAVAFVARHPYGAGLGASTLASRFQGARPEDVPTTAESTFLEVGVEFGVLPMLCFVGLVLTVLVRGARGVGDDVERHGLLLAFTGLVLVGLVLHVFVEPPVTYTAWAFAGLLAPAALSPPPAPTGSRRRAALPSLAS